MPLPGWQRKDSQQAALNRLASIEGLATPEREKAQGHGSRKDKPAWHATMFPDCFVGFGMVLLEIDPTAAIIAPWMQLGVIGSVVIALGVVCVYLWKSLSEARAAHLAEVKACAAQTLDITIKKIESDNKLADALESVERVVEAALAAIKR